MSVPTTVKGFYSAASQISAYFNGFVSKYDLEGRARADHICYKCSSADSFEKMRWMLEKESDYMFQSIISERRIAIIKLKVPVATRLGDIYFLELADQKPDNSQNEGFDHIEAYPVGWSYEEMVQKLRDDGLEVAREVRKHHITHGIKISPSYPFIFRCTREPLIEKIKREEMK